MFLIEPSLNTTLFRTACTFFPDLYCAYCRASLKSITASLERACVRRVNRCVDCTLGPWRVLGLYTCLAFFLQRFSQVFAGNVSRTVFRRYNVSRIVFRPCFTFRFLPFRWRFRFFRSGGRLGFLRLGGIYEILLANIYSCILLIRPHFSCTSKKAHPANLPISNPGHTEERARESRGCSAQFSNPE